jgi:hypothetical protein
MTEQKKLPRGFKGNVLYDDQRGWKARLVFRLPTGAMFRRETFHYNPMSAGAVLKSYREEARRALAACT